MFWINSVLFFLLIAGHAELLVTLINRIHGLPLPCRLLRHVRHLHDLWIPVFPLVLVWFVGIRGPGLLVGGHWSELPVGWAVYLNLCGLGTVGLLWQVFQRRIAGIPEFQLSNHSATVDIADRLGHRPISPGPFRFLAYVPGNEIFKLDVTEKTYRLPRLPQPWDGLSILQLTDLHFIGTIDRVFFEHIAELSEQAKADMIVMTGDLLDNQRLVEWLPMTLGRLKAPMGCYFVLGNHDWYLDPPETRRWLEELGWHDVAGRCTPIEHEGHTLAIGGSEVPWMGEQPDFSTAPDDAFRLLLSHTPDNLNWARKQHIDLMLCGHNHGGQVVLPLIGPVYSPSTHGVRYAGGVYWEEPTLMYVSRGLSGRHPLRLGAKPELVQFILRSP